MNVSKSAIVGMCAKVFHTDSLVYYAAQKASGRVFPKSFVGDDVHQVCSVHWVLSFSSSFETFNISFIFFAFSFYFIECTVSALKTFSCVSRFTALTAVHLQKVNAKFHKVG